MSHLELPFPASSSLLIGKLSNLEWGEFPEALDSTRPGITRAWKGSEGHPIVEEAYIGLYPERFHFVWIEHGERVAQSAIPFEQLESVEVKRMRWPPWPGAKNSLRKMKVTGKNGVVQFWRVGSFFAGNAEYVFRRARSGSGPGEPNPSQF